MTAGTGNSAPIFEVEDAAFAVAGRQLLHPLSLALPMRSVVGLIGQNGSGKSTLIKLLARQQRPTGGTIRLEGRAVPDWSDRSFARRVGYLPQSTPPTAGMLVRELVALGRYPWHGSLGRFSVQDRQKVAEAMALTDLGSLANRFVDTLSGGERQRAWLAMLVSQHTDYLLLDEPIAALDVAHQIEVLALIRRLAQERGVGVLIVLHDVNMAARFCDRIIALRAGKVEADGPPREVFRPATLHNVYGVEMDVIEHPALGVPVALAR